MRDITGKALAREIDSKGSKHQSDQRFYGLYRGTCVDNVDDHVLRRVRVRVAEFYGDDPGAGFDAQGIATKDLPWAHPCLMPGGTQVPSVGDQVWVAFEKGDTNRPVWLGVYPTAPVSLREAVVNALSRFTSLFQTQQSQGAVVVPPTIAPTPPPETDLDKVKKHANNWDIDARFLMAIRLTENGRAGREFGVLGVKSAKDFDGQADVAAETVAKTLDRYRNNIKKEPIGQDGRYTDSFIKYFSHGGPGYPGYAPLGAANDPTNLNANHFNNMKTNYAATSFE